jgi:hypothetical protein
MEKIKVDLWTSMRMTLPRAQITAYFNSVTFGHLAANLVTNGHHFRGLFHLTFIGLNSREINIFACLKQLTIATDTFAPALGTVKPLCRYLQGGFLLQVGQIVGLISGW